MVKRVFDCYHFFDLPKEEPLISDQKARYLAYLAKSHEDGYLNKESGKWKSR